MTEFRKRITASGVSYLETGETGPLLVFSHGYRDSVKGWKWAARGLVEQGWHVALVQRNEAATAAGDSSAALDAYAAQVIDVIDEFDGGAEGVVLVGHSMGAAVAELAAATLGAKLRGLVLVNPAPAGRHTASRGGARAVHRRNGADEPGGRRAGQARAHRPPQRRTSCAAHGIHRRRVHGVGLGKPLCVGRWTSRRSRTISPLRSGPGGRQRRPVEEMLRSVVIPRFSRVNVVTIRDAGHFVHIERPVALASRIQEFVTSV